MVTAIPKKRSLLSFDGNIPRKCHVLLDTLAQELWATDAVVSDLLLPNLKWEIAPLTADGTNALLRDITEAAQEIVDGATIDKNELHLTTSALMAQGDILNLCIRTFDSPYERAKWVTAEKWMATTLVGMSKYDRNALLLIEDLHNLKGHTYNYLVSLEEAVYELVAEDTTLVGLEDYLQAQYRKALFSDVERCLHEA